MSHNSFCTYEFVATSCESRLVRQPQICHTKFPLPEDKGLVDFLSVLEIDRQLSGAPLRFFRQKLLHKDYTELILLPQALTLQFYPT